MMMYSLLKDTKNCQVCNKSFPNGRALGGHMRSHNGKRSASNAESATGSAIPSLKTSNKLGANFRPQETVLVRSAHTREVGAGPKPDLKREEDRQQRTGKKKIIVDLDEVDSTELGSRLTVEDEGALLLVAMSKGQRPENSQNWTAIESFLSTLKEKEEHTEKYIEIDSDDDGKEGKYKSVADLLASDVGIITEDNDEDDAADDDDGDETYLVAREKQCKKKYVCDICGKILHSYQALGGHRTSHRNKRLKLCDKNDQTVVRLYECEICGRVFESGQALGGHKKVHYLFLQTK